MRPLAFDDPSKERAWAHPLQYRLGRHLVVAPVTEPGAAEWPIYLPAGEWVDLEALRAELGLAPVSDRRVGYGAGQLSPPSGER